MASLIQNETVKRCALLTFVAALSIALAFWVARGRVAIVSIQELSMHREHWLGRRVRCEGRLKAFRDKKSGQYYTLDRDGYRVAILGVPNEQLEAFLGKDASTSGIFQFRDDFGAYIQTDRLIPVGR